MPRSPLFRLCCAVFVLTVLASGPLAAAGPAAPEPTLGSSLAGLWGENGCYIDPYGGGCQGSTAGVPSPRNRWRGCYIDPYGGCLGLQDLDEGCYIDPYGGCRDGR